MAQELPASVRAKLDTLPPRPGVYVFHDHDGAVLYVGKARSLRSRVRSYFQPGTSDVRAFVARLERELGDIQTFVAETEKEAALLENELIKEHQPRYNIKLRDDKDYLSLRLRPGGYWPRLEVVRRPKKDGARYFGPYHSATAARQTLRLVNRHFQLRTCTDTELRSRSRPCLQYQIKRCPGPCAVEVDRESYAQQVRSVALFLDGRHDELLVGLKERMIEASQEMEYEQAALYRDQLKAVERVREKQRVATVKDIDQDVFGFYRLADQVEVAVLTIRDGKLRSVYTYDLKDVSLPNDELLSSFVGEWYHRAPVPDEILLPTAIEAMEGFGERLAEGQRSRPGRRAVPRLIVPKRGERLRLIAMADDNAEHAFFEKQRQAEDIEARLEQVQAKLRLPHLPRTIECIDVSHSGGDDAVAAIVALQNGQPYKEGYRSFHIKRAQGGDDYGSMYEALTRRFRRGRDGDKGWTLPDLLVVDGGKGQLGVALAALKDLGMTLPVAALAKEKELKGGKVVDRIYLPGQKNAIALRSTAALQMLALARDEAHRSSNHLRKKRQNKRQFTSELDNIKGIGPKTRSKLLQTLGSLDAVRKANLDELVAAGASRAQAEAIQKGLAAAPKATPATQDSASTGTTLGAAFAASRDPGNE